MILGVDGGGTKTVAAVVDASGSLLGTGRSGPSNYQVIGLEAAVASVRTAVRAALAGAARGEHVSCAVLGLAGADFAKDRLRLTEALARADEFAGIRLEVRNDVEVALVGAVGGLRGVAVCAGTGAICVGMDGRDRVARADGWGYLLGDEGSGYWMGQEALRVVARRHDGRGRLGRGLEGALIAALGLSDATDLLDWAYRGPASVNEVAALASIVLDEARSGDVAAAGIVRRAGERLGEAACSVIRQLGLDRQAFPLVAVGGLFQSPSAAALRASLMKAVRDVAPRGRWQTPLLPAELGAVLLGAILGGRDSGEVVAGLRRAAALRSEHARPA